MNKKLKDKWIKALRSGDYKQGHGYLKRATDSGTVYCCLGVLCEIGKIRSSSLSMIRDDEDNTKVLPQRAQDDLAEWNDKGRSFKWIAAYIKRYV